jgi:peptidyl-prolyl cis-trans isomerase C
MWKLLSPELTVLTIALLLLNGCGQQNDATTAGGMDTPPQAQAVTSKDGELGSVNGVPLPREEFLLRAREQRPNLPSALGGEDGEFSVCFKRRLVWELIDETLLRKEAERRDVQIKDAEVDQAIGVFAEGFDSPDAFQQYLSTRPGGGESLRREQHMSLLHSRLAGSPPPVTDDEVALFYQQHLARYKHPAFLLADEIVLLNREGRDEHAELSALRERILNENLSFRHQAGKHSEGDTAKRGGNMGRVTSTSVQPVTWNAIRALGAGQISAPITLEDRTMLVQVRDRIAAASVSLSQARDSIRHELTSRLQRSREKELVATLRRQATVHNSFETTYLEAGAIATGGGVSLEELLERDLKQGGKTDLPAKEGL